MTGRPPWFGIPAFEDAVLDAIIHDAFGADSKIEMQGLRLRARYYTGAGLYSEFFYEENQPAKPDPSVASKPIASSWRLQHIFGPAREPEGRSRFRRAVDRLLRRKGRDTTAGSKQTISSDIYATVAGADDIGLGFLLFLENNRVTTLEAFTYGGDDPWWGPVDQFSLYRSPFVSKGETAPFRPLRPEESAIVAALCDAAQVRVPDAETLGRLRARDVGDPAGAMRFFDVEAVPRRVERILAEAEYQDEDGATARVVLWLDDEGNLFGLDMWKPDFAPLLRYPTPGNLNIRTVAGARIIGNANLDMMIDAKTFVAMTAGRDRPDNRERDGLAWLQSWYLSSATVCGSMSSESTSRRWTIPAGT